MKNLVTLTAAFTLFATATLAQDFAALPASYIPIKQVVQLQSNTVNDVRHVLSADRATGLAQIGALSERSQFEEQWVFVPGLDLWVEVGIHEVATDANSEVELDLEYMQAVASAFDEVLLVHFHPSEYYRAGRWSQGLFNHQFPAADLIAGEVAPIGFALPSTSDIVGSVQLMDILTNSNPNINVQFAVVSPHGVVEFGPTVAGRRNMAFNKGNPRQNTLRDLAVGNALHRSQPNIEHLVAVSDDASIGDIITALCAQEAGEFYAMTYTPAKD